MSSASRAMRRKLERQTRKVSMSDLYKHVDAVERKIEVRRTDKETEKTMYSFSCVMAMCCRVLVNEFHWGKLPKDENFDAPEYFRLVRFCRAVEDEVNALAGTKNSDIEEYCKKVYDEIGVMFVYK